MDQVERSKFKRDKIAKTSKDSFPDNSTTSDEVITHKNKKVERELQKKAAEQNNARLKAEKKLKKADEEYNEMASVLASKHSFPSMVNSVIFLLLARILGTEYQGKVVAILPFVPYAIVRKISQRGLEAGIDPRACSFTFIFFLCSMSVKSIVSKIFGRQTPPGVGITNFLETPRAQRLLAKYGLPDLNESFEDSKKSK